MKSIEKIIVTFEYLINGWQVTLLDSNGKELDFIKEDLENELSNISSNWLMNIDEEDMDEDEEFDEEDFLNNPSDYVDEEPIIEGICKYLCIKKQDVEFKFEYSSDT